MMMASYELGRIYEILDIDYSMVYNYYNMSAACGYSKALYSLGSLYARGKFVNKNYEEASYWYKKAALKKHAKAFFSLGLLYEYGLLITEDHKYIEELFKKSYELGGIYALEHLNNIMKGRK